jgi:anti-sigma B factor antagonist
MQVRPIDERTSVVDIQGSVTASSEAALMDAYGKAAGQHTRTIVLNFEQLEYLNSSGIGLLVTLLVRANRHGQRLIAYGLNEHYRHIFELTRLSDAVAIYSDERTALLAVGSD